MTGLLMLIAIVLGALLPVAGFLFTLGLLVEPQVLCFFFRWHSYDSANDYSEQASVCRHCSKIKWH
jgi:hypothetical protein